MPSNRSRHLVRRLGTALLGWALLMLVTLGLASALRDAWDRRATGAAAPGPALDALLASAGLAVCGWMLLSALAAIGAHLPGTLGRMGSAATTALTPRVARRLVAVLAGTAIGAAPATTALAAAGVSDATGSRGAVVATATPSPPASGHGPQGASATSTAPGPATGSAAAATTVSVDPAWVPTTPGPETTPALLTPSPRSEPAPDTVVVRRGDTLWAIAARHHGDAATDAEIARSWPRWYAVNRTVIGADPDRLVPGSQLVAPDAEEVR